MSSAASLRQFFLDYFAKHGHTIVKSSALVPSNDPTLMFTNAGMVQFKDVFVGQETRPYKRATTSQKCMRVSGKHNDLEEVGRTARHHTFFEMLGNFSFGDYFKEEAIELAWDLITKELELDTSRLWVTVFGGEGGLPPDDEARELWKKIAGLSDDRIIGCGMKDNFWAMGDTGPCGPCTEIHYDTADASAPTPTMDDFESGRVVEIWNNVFMQFERKTKDADLIDLPAPSVDTGMGLERLAAVVQGEVSNYHTPLFLPILETMAERVGKPYTRSDGEDDVSMRVIADHARATAFLVADGIQPSNEGRGYVMRRIMRRAIRHGKRLGFDDLFFHVACEKVVDIMKDAYPELTEALALITKVAENEEKSFRRTLDTGLKMLEEEIGSVRDAGSKELAGDFVFRLYDTYGFPMDLTQVIAEENSLSVDQAGFDKEMEAQKTRSRAEEGGPGDAAIEGVYKDLRQKLGEVEFVGYTHEDVPADSSERTGTWRTADLDGVPYLEVQTAVKAIVQGGKEVRNASDGELALVLDPTPFYGESGGQVGDHGIIQTDDGALIEITDSQKPFEGFTVTRGRLLKGSVNEGQQVWAGYQPAIRKETRAHHSATHLLHGSLRKVLGEHVKQAGSLVDPDHLRFDFSHFEATTHDELRAIEDDANQRVEAKHEVSTDVLPFDEAKERGAIAMFGEKYGDVVRVITMGESVEFCGGTHAKNTGDIGMILVTREEAVSAGVRRIEAEVGEAARRTARKTAERLGKAAELIGAKVSPDSIEGNDDSILRAVAKTVRQYDELAAGLGDVGAEAVTASRDVQPPTLADGFALAEARGVRDQWQGLVQLTNARGADAKEIAERAKSIDGSGLLRAFAEMSHANRENERKLQDHKRQGLMSQSGDLLERAKDVGGIKVLATEVEGADGKALRQVADQLRDRLGSGVLCLAASGDGKVSLLIAVTSDLTGRFKAGSLLKELAPIVDGRGGGKPEMAQGGGSKPEKLPDLFAKLEELLG